MSPGRRRDLMKRSFIFFLAAAASFVVTWLVVWFVLLQKADATTSPPMPSKAVANEPFKTPHAPKPTTTRNLALDQAAHLHCSTIVQHDTNQSCVTIHG